MRRSRSSLWLAGLLAIVGTANLLVLLAQAPRLVHSLYLNADDATSLVLPALAGRAQSGAIVNLGDHPWYEPWWFMRTTAGLPGYHQLWEVAPFIFGLLGIAAVTGCAWWALGRLAGLLCGVALLATSEVLRGILYTPEVHGLIVLHVGVMCGALLLAHRWARAGRLTPAALLMVGVPFVVFTGAGLTDQLLLVSGLGPFVLAPLVCWLRLGSRVWRTVSLFAFVTGLCSGLLALLLAHVMNQQHVVHAPFPIDFVGSEALVGGLQNLVVAFASLGGGAFFGTAASGVNLLTFAAGALALLALAAVLRGLWRWVSLLAAPREPLSREAGARELFVAYWGLVLVFVLGAFALTALSGTASNSRYIIGAWVAVAALLGVLATSAVARTTIVLAVALFGVLNIRAELAGGVPAFGPGPGLRMAGEIERFAAANGAKVGYGGYWDASPVTWETHLRVELYPIQACDTPSGWCQFYNNQISSWYAPRANTRTFLLTDTRPGIPLAVAAPPTSFGHPVAGESLGEGLTVYIYSHDIAADLSP